jgi:hypothetical protein
LSLDRGDERRPLEERSLQTFEFLLDAFPLDSLWK